MKVIVCDLDGCLFNTAWIWGVTNELGLMGEKKWDFFHKNVNSEKSCTCEEMKNFLKDIIAKDTLIIFMTARSEEIRFATEERILNELPELAARHILLMRPYNNYDSSEVVKEKLLNIAINDYNYHISFAIDDEPKNCAMFEKYGIPTLQWKLINDRTISNETEKVQA